MAENTTSPNASPETPQGGQPQATSERPPSQPEQERKPVNLQDFEEFRKYQSAKDRELRQMRQESQQQIAQLQAQLEALQTRDMPDEERTRYEVQKRDRYIQQLQQQMQGMQAEQARVAALAEISSETGAPLDVLMEADNPDDAWRRGNRWMRENLSKTQQKQLEAEAEERKANQVDLGRGSSAASGSFESRLRDVRKNGGTVSDLWKLRREYREREGG